MILGIKPILIDIDLCIVKDTDNKRDLLIEGHSLIYLCKEASNYYVEFKNHLKDCAFVNQYYIETRYPSDIPLFHPCLTPTTEIFNGISCTQKDN